MERHRKNLSKESENRETQTREGVAARSEGHGHSGERESEPGPHGWQGLSARPRAERGSRGSRVETRHSLRAGANMGARRPRLERLWRMGKKKKKEGQRECTEIQPFSDTVSKR